MSTAFAIGWKKDEYDHRDLDAVPRLQALRAASPNPKAARCASITKVVNQGQLGSCTANSSGQAVRAAQLLEMVELARAAWAKAGNDPSKFDAAAALAQAQKDLEFWARLFVYYLVRAYDHNTAQDSGGQIRNVFQAINKYGYAPESSWTYDDDSRSGAKFSQMPPSEVFRLAYDQRSNVANQNANLVDYERITSEGDARVEDIKTAVAQNHLVVFGTPVTETFCNDGSANGGKPIARPASSDKIAGGHAICVAGYDDDGAEIVNSWGEDYGGGGATSLPPGWCKFSWDYMTWSSTSDLWIVKRAPMLQAA